MATKQLSLQGQGKIFVGSASVTISALAAAAEEDLSITESNATVGDVVMVTLPNAAVETGVGVVAAWVSTGGTIKIRVTNLNAAAALTGGAATVAFALLRA